MESLDHLLSLLGQALALIKQFRPVPQPQSMSQNSRDRPLIVFATDELSEYLHHRVILGQSLFSIKVIIELPPFTPFVYISQSSFWIIHSKILLPHYSTFQHLEIEDLVRQSKFRFFLRSNEPADQRCFESKIIELLIRRTAPSLFISNQQNVQPTRVSLRSSSLRLSSLGSSTKPSLSEAGVQCPWTLIGPPRDIGRVELSDPIIDLGRYDHLDNSVATTTTKSTTTMIEWTAEWVVNVVPLHITADQRFLDSIDVLTARLVRELGTNPYVYSSHESGSSIPNSNVPTEQQHPYSRLLASLNDDIVFPHLRLFEISDIKIKVDFTARRRSKKFVHRDGWMKDAVNMILSAVGGIKDLKIRLPGQTLRGIRLYPDAFFLSSSNLLGSDFCGADFCTSIIPALRGDHLQQVISPQFLGIILGQLMSGGWKGALHPPAIAAAAAMHAPPVLAIRRVQQSAQQLLEVLQDGNSEDSKLSAVSLSVSSLVKRCSIEVLWVILMAITS